MFLSSYLCKTTATPWPLGGFCWNKSIVILVYTEDNKSIQFNSIQFNSMQAVRRCRRLASAPFAARLVFCFLITTRLALIISLPESLNTTNILPEKSPLVVTAFFLLLYNRSNKCVVSGWIVCGWLVDGGWFEIRGW